MGNRRAKRERERRVSREDPLFECQERSERKKRLRDRATKKEARERIEITSATEKGRGRMRGKEGERRGTKDVGR